MSRSMVVMLVGGVAVCLAGCVHGGNTRLPLFAPSDPVAEANSYRFHDPYPDEGSGPETSHRPRDFAQQRSDPRRAAEQQLLQGMPPQYGPVPYGAPQSLAPGYPSPGAAYVPPATEYPQIMPY